MKTYEILPEDLELAVYLADKIASVDSDSKNKLVLIENHDLIGFLGMLAVEKLLLEHNIDYEYHEISPKPIHEPYDYKVGEFHL